MFHLPHFFKIASVLAFLFIPVVWAISSEELGRVVIGEKATSDFEHFRISFRDGSSEIITGEQYGKRLSDNQKKVREFYDNPNVTAFNKLDVFHKLRVAEYAANGEVDSYHKYSPAQNAFVLGLAKDTYNSVPNDIKIMIQINAIQDVPFNCDYIKNNETHDKCLDKVKGKLRTMFENIGRLDPSRLGEAACTASSLFGRWDPDVNDGPPERVIRETLNRLVYLEENSEEYKKSRNVMCPDEYGGQYSLADRFMAAKKKAQANGSGLNKKAVNSQMPLLQNYYCSALDTVSSVKDDRDLLVKAKDGSKAYTLVNLKRCFISYDIRKVHARDYQIQFRNQSYMLIGPSIPFSNMKEFVTKVYGGSVAEIPTIKKLIEGAVAEADINGRASR